MLSDDLRLTPRQRRCLDAIERANGRAASRASLREAMYLPGYAPGDFDNLLKVTIFQIRSIMRAAKIEREIETVWGRGYRLTAPLPQAI